MPGDEKAPTDMVGGQNANGVSNTPRALLTEGEKDAVRGDIEMDDNLRASYLARVRRKIVKIKDDARLLREHRPPMGEELEAAVCGGEIDIDDAATFFDQKEVDDRLDHLEERIDRIEERIEANIDVSGNSYETNTDATNTDTE